MITWNKRFCFFIAFLYLICCYSEESKNKPIQKYQLQVAEDLAQVLWHVMQSYEGAYSFQELIVNLWRLNVGQQESKPLNECFASLIDALEKKATEQEIKNLQIADFYLQELKSVNGIHELVKDKLYYKVITPGIGEAVEDLSSSSPLIAFKEKTIHGDILADNTSGIRLPFSEVIAGFRSGLAGIKLGEKREIFIHPDLAYREFPKPEPCSLIIIEVTLISL